MTTLNRSALALCCLLCFTFLCPAQEQEQQPPPTPFVEVTADARRAQFSALGELQQMRVEIFAPSGERVFDSGAVRGQTIEWDMRDKRGARISDGVYLATVSTVDSTGKVTKRVEQIVVGASQSRERPAANAPPTSDAPVTTGNGTAGKIAKFSSAANIENSIITESAGKIGVGTTAAPTATLQVNGPQPAPQPGTGTEATPLLLTSGGKGGNSTTAGEIAGRGASILLMGGSGGNTISGSTNGSGGSITLQGGSVGTGGVGGSSGNVLLAPTLGNVGIGTNAPTSKLMVTGSASTNIVSVENTSNVLGTVGVLVKSRGVSVLGISTSGTSAGVRGEGPYGVWGKTNTSGRAGVYGDGATSSYGVQGKSISSPGVYGESEGLNEGGVYGVNNTNSIYSKGVYGFSSKGYGVYGHSTTGYAGGFLGSIQVTGAVYFGSETRQMINLYSPFYGIGVQSSTHYFRTNGGFAWYYRGLHTDTANSPGNGGTRLMKLDSAGNLSATTFNPTSDRNAKANFSAVNPRLILNKLAAVPIQTWNYKADENPVRHIGATAQDFRAAFDLGADDKSISTVDADGVTMAAVQGLYQMMLEQERASAEKDKKIEQLSRKLEELQNQLQEVRRDVRRQRGARRRGR